MLKSLQIQNIALIDNLSVLFSPGMNCLTGETGAGKSIMIDAISALMGSRTSKELIRSGTELGRVCGEFTDVSAYTIETLQQLGIPHDDVNRVTLEREIALSGRNLCRVNGKTVTGAVLRQVGETLIDIHGQHDNQSLTKPESHGRLLDAFSGAEMAALLKEYSDTLKLFKERQKALEALSGDPASRARAADLLLYQIREIEGAQLSIEEEETLVQRRNILDHGEKVDRSLRLASSILLSDNESAHTILSMIGELKHELSGIGNLSSELESLLGDVDNLLYEAEALADQVRAASESFHFDPAEADWVRKRYDYIQTLKGKYGDNVEAVLNFLEEAKAQYAFLTGSEEQAAEIMGEMQDLSGELYGLCEEISFTRKKYGDLLEQRIQDELEDLEMPGTRFAVRLDFSYETDDQGFPEFGKYGLDDVEFLISANPGEPLLPLARIASGGELSRIMLAVKRILNESDRVSTMIFDEIDTGISGVAARKIAEKMRVISGGHQVICVTHHAQIAAAADHNLYVSKEASGERTVTRVDILDSFTKIQEISRLLDGDKENAITNDHARTLIERYHS